LLSSAFSVNYMVRFVIPAEAGIQRKDWIPDQACPARDTGSGMTEGKALPLAYSKQKGFTLIEILIAVLLLALVLTTVYASYSGTFKIIRLSGRDSDVYSMARGYMEIMISDLSSTVISGVSVKFVSNRQEMGDHAFSGLTFRSAAHISFNDNEISPSISTISYYVEENRDDHGFMLMRSDDPLGGFDTGSEKKSGLIVCQNVAALTLKFYDGLGKESDSWSSLTGPEEQKNKAPAMVSIQLDLENPETKDHPYRFMTKVFLPVNKIDRENK
jgi:general secretion pathway protein J